MLAAAVAGAVAFVSGSAPAAETIVATGGVAPDSDARFPPDETGKNLQKGVDDEFEKTNEVHVAEVAEVADGARGMLQKLSAREVKRVKQRDWVQRRDWRHGNWRGEERRQGNYQR